MNEQEVYELLQTGDLKITFDANAIYASKKFLNICDNINIINETLKFKIKIIISSLVHTEKLFDLKQEYKDTYNIDNINGALNSKNVVIKPFTVHHAESVAKWIGTQFSTNDEWYKFKRQESINCLGINEANCDIPQNTGKKCGARIDWLIAGFAYTEDYLLITDDKGNEFKNITKKTKLNILESSLERIKPK